MWQVLSGNRTQERLPREEDATKDLQRCCVVSVCPFGAPSAFVLAAITEVGQTPLTSRSAPPLSFELEHALSTISQETKTKNKQ